MTHRAESGVCVPESSDAYPHSHTGVTSMLPGVSTQPVEALVQFLLANGLTEATPESISSQCGKVLSRIAQSGQPASFISCTGPLRVRARPSPRTVARRHFSVNGTPTHNRGIAQSMPRHIERESRNRYGILYPPKTGDSDLHSFPRSTATPQPLPPSLQGCIGQRVTASPSASVSVSRDGSHTHTPIRRDVPSGLFPPPTHTDTPASCDTSSSASDASGDRCLPPSLAAIADMLAMGGEGEGGAPIQGTPTTGSTVTRLDTHRPSVLKGSGSGAHLLQRPRGPRLLATPEMRRRRERERGREGRGVVLASPLRSPYHMRLRGEIQMERENLFRLRHTASEPVMRTGDSTSVTGSASGVGGALGIGIAGHAPPTPTPGTVGTASPYTSTASTASAPVVFPMALAGSNPTGTCGASGGVTATTMQPQPTGTDALSGCGDVPMTGDSSTAPPSATIPTDASVVEVPESSYRMTDTDSVSLMSITDGGMALTSYMHVQA
ncbi:hypothetical protein KIPB_006423 [Kipferlia bialata]|uniref:Uncharacterized protein n=1 Tax=Kipferlia bialata TaxID=797122 RepID=A0A9K3GEW5_9EUKA|nr:hypothetical protein KIPB_002357 [Kipferlia bialata]GIQ84849.1 hypothetical protein KIPB_006423 [Kipferlia bialata]|eukprot:g2357.t1